MKLYAGPYIGEFGWELCWWNPMIRQKSKQFDQIIIAAHKGSEYLYEFADEFIPLDAEGWCNAEGECITLIPKINADIYIDPSKIPINVFGIHAGLKWRNLSPSNCIKKADIMCAFRPFKIHPKTKQFIDGKDYPRLECENVINLLLDLGFSVACYGGSKNYCFDGTIDLREMNLKDLCGALNTAQCALGPSSGTIHLASLCGCRHVTWYRQKSNFPPHKTLHTRYEKTWNPFNTAVKYLHEKPPAPEIIIKAVMDLINNEDSI